jgi:hypothetical protein
LKNIETDKRAKKISECIEGMKIIKFSAWEIVFLKAINLIRRKETKKNFELFFLRSMQDTVLMILPSIIAFLTIILYQKINGESLSLEETFSIIMSYNLVMGPARACFVCSMAASAALVSID